MTCFTTISEPVEKQPYELWPLAVDFTDDLDPTDEDIVLGSSVILAWDKNGDDATSDILDNQKALATNPDRDDARTNASLQEVIKNGDPTLSPYNISYRIVTDAGNKFEKDVQLKVKEKIK